MHDQDRLEACVLAICPELRGLNFRVIASDDIPESNLAALDKKHVIGMSGPNLGHVFDPPHEGPCVAVNNFSIRRRWAYRGESHVQKSIWHITLHELAHLFDNEPPYFGWTPRIRSDKDAHGPPWIRLFLALGERSRRRWPETSFTAAELLDGYTRSDGVSEQYWLALRPQVLDHLADLEALKAKPMPMATVAIAAGEGFSVSSDVPTAAKSIDAPKRRLPMLTDRFDDPASPPTYMHPSVKESLTRHAKPPRKPNAYPDLYMPPPCS